MNGRDYTIIDGQNTQTSGWNVVIQSAYAVIDGLTISNGFCKNYQASGIFLNQYGRVINSRITHCWGDGQTWPGSGVYLNYGGTMINCIIENCKAGLNGGGVYVNNPGGIVSNCLIRNNTAWKGGGAVLFKGGLLTDSVVVSNQAPSHLSRGAGVYGEGGGTIRNTLIADNVAFNRDWATAAGGGASLYGKDIGRTEMINCTLVGNVAAGGGGVYLEGTNQTWMTKSLDLDGNRRLSGDRVDIGAYEFRSEGIQIILK